MTDDEYNDEYQILATLPGGMQLTLRWRDAGGGALALLERSWWPAEPDVLPQGLRDELLRQTAGYLNPTNPEDAVAAWLLNLPERAQPVRMTP